MLTAEQKDKVLIWAGWKPNPDGNPYNLVWIQPNGNFRMKSELNTLDELMEIAGQKLTEIWGERISIDFRHWEEKILAKPKEKVWHCLFARWINDVPGYEKVYNGFVLQAGGFGDTQVESLQNALLKIVEGNYASH